MTLEYTENARVKITECPFCGEDMRGKRFSSHLIFHCEEKPERDTDDSPEE